jgi:acyl-coenzyme A synthetase/AMP-(fatty) acid ligase
MLPTKTVIMSAGLGRTDDMSSLNDFDWIEWDDFVQLGKEKSLGRTKNGEIEWKRLPFDWPIWILFSSGTTGESERSFWLIELELRVPYYGFNFI